MNQKTVAMRDERPTPLRRRDVEKFLAAYQEAWEAGNAELAASLFTRDVSYQQAPFTEPIRGREAVHDYWASVTRRQSDVRFTVKNWIHKNFVLVAEWHCTYRERGDAGKELAGVFIADFYGKQVRSFREYFASRKAEHADKR